mgnify:CR=1 FL=1
MAQKLELTWYGKEDKFTVEPRIMIENKALSNTKHDENTENILIHGDNLLALKALEKKYAGKVKCIYIDPPYNIDAATGHYDDNLEHSQWLSLMRPRLELLRSLMSDDGLIFVQIDDNEQAYLRVIMDEIFGRSNFISTVAVKMSTVSGVKTAHRDKTILKEKELIHVFSKDKDYIKLKPQYVPVYEWDKEFQYYLDRGESNDPNDWKVTRLKDVLEVNRIPYNPENKSFKKFVEEHKSSIWRRAFIRNRFKQLSQDNPDKVFRNISDEKEHLYYRGREMFFLCDKYHDCFTEDGVVNEMSVLLADMWMDINTGKLFNEGGVEFRNSKKPEFLVSRILNLATNENDLVLDSFLGSGTTAAVAHKMNRRWIGIEMGDHAYTHCKVRLDSVIEGSDQGGITKTLDWQGGGGYKFYELAPSLIKEDNFGELVINKEYSADMLASAVALHEGFTYQPSDELFWKQSKGNEKSFLFVTTRFIDQEYLARIKETMHDDEFLIIACKSYDSACEYQFKNIKIKKIPNMLLSKCEFGKDNYNLNIINPPIYEDEEEDDEE